MTNVAQPRTQICGIEFSCLDRDHASQWLFNSAKCASGGYVCVTGAHGVVMAHENGDFRNLLNSAAMNTLDGQPVVLLARSRGYSVERVTGRELLRDIVALDNEAELHHILFGSVCRVTDLMASTLRTINSRVQVRAFNPPFGELSDAALDEICGTFALKPPVIIWVGLSTPKQEALAARLAERFPFAPIVAIGAGFDFVAGLTPCAPKIVTTLCLEWLFRLLCEPLRLFRRYASVVPKFLRLLILEIAEHEKLRKISP